MKQIIDEIFNSVKYWKDKNLLLNAIPLDYFSNKNIIIRLLWVTPQSVSSINEAKREMWNYMLLHEKLGDSILQRVNKKLLDDIDFVELAVGKYNRSYLYASKRLQASREIAKLAATAEKEPDETTHTKPILYYMPEIFKEDNEIAVIATTRNIDNLQYATNLRKNKYFIIDMMNMIENQDMKERILAILDNDLLNDKNFVSKLGCFDTISDNFKEDAEFVAAAVKNDLDILKKTEIFDELILQSALENDAIYTQKEMVMGAIFRYIEKFNTGYGELNSKIKNKKILEKLFWEMGEIISEEFI